MWADVRVGEAAAKPSNCFQAQVSVAYSAEDAGFLKGSATKCADRTAEFILYLLEYRQTFLSYSSLRRVWQ